MREVEIYNYGESTYNKKEFEKYWSKGISNRVDVTFYTRAKSKAEALRKFLVVPCIEAGGSVNWVRQRICKGHHKRLDKIITEDNTVYCTALHNLYIGKFVEGVWHPEEIKLKPIKIGTGKSKKAETKARKKSERLDDSMKHMTKEQKLEWLRRRQNEITEEMTELSFKLAVITVLLNKIEGGE